MSSKTILIRPILPAVQPADAPPLFRVTFQGFRDGNKVALEIGDASPPQPSVWGKVEGSIERAGGKPESPLFKLTPSGSHPRKTDVPQIGLVFATEGNSPIYYIDLPAEKAGQNEGTAWTMEVRAPALHVRSAPFVVAYARRMPPSRFVAAPRATYDRHDGNCIQFYNDGSEGPNGTAGAFDDVHKAIIGAQSFIFIADWSFHPAMRLDRSRTDLSSTVGGILIKQAYAHPKLLIAIHTWTHIPGSPDSQNNDAKEVLNRMAKAMDYTNGCPPNLLWRSSRRTGAFWTHHQKFVALDSPGTHKRREVKAFFGGLDLTKGRFDWPDHPIMADEPDCDNLTTRVVVPDERARLGDGAKQYDDWYNAEFDGAEPAKDDKFDLPREPWHDIYAQITGPTAWDIVREFVGRWNLDPSVASTGLNGDGLGTAPRINDKFLKEMMSWKKPGERSGATPEAPDFVQQWEPREGAWAAQVLRSIESVHWTRPINNSMWGASRKEMQWHLPKSYERSIQYAYLRAIAQAEHYIYIETQYFCGSGDQNPIPDALGDKIAERIGAGVPFHVYLLMPMYPEGPPGGILSRSVRVGEWQALGRVIGKVHDSVSGGKRWDDYLTLGYLAQCRGPRDHKLLQLADCTKKGDARRAEMLEHNRRHMIYIHSKFMCVDDRYVILGSANLNQRSIAGDRDSEICVACWPASPAHEKDCVEEIKRLRTALWAEHLGSAPGSAAAGLDPASPECIQIFRDVAKENVGRYYSGLDNTGFGHLMRWPIRFDNGLEFVNELDDLPGFAFDGAHIPDGLNNDDFRWMPAHDHAWDRAL